MGFLDTLKGTLQRELNKTLKDASATLQKKARDASQKRWTVTFETLPKNLEELRALPEADLKEPYKAAALCIAAYCVWPDDREESKKMLQFLSGPRELTPMFFNQVQDRFMDGKNYIPFSFFEGATPENDYTPSKPYTITVYDNPNYKAEGYYGVLLRSGGADSMRQLTLRHKPSTGQWFLWEDFTLGGIRIPKSADKWA